MIRREFEETLAEEMKKNECWLDCCRNIRDTKYPNDEIIAKIEFDQAFVDSVAAKYQIKREATVVEEVIEEVKVKAEPKVKEEPVGE